MVRAIITNKVIVAKVVDKGIIARITNKIIRANISGGITTYVYGLTATAPAHYNSTGMAGQMAYDDDYFYVCVATDRWMKTPGIKNF